MFNRTSSIKIFAPKLPQRTDQPQPKADRPQVDLAEPRPQINTDESLSNNLTADFRRFSQIRNRTFHRRDAEYAKGRIFAQSGDDDWAKQFCLNADKFLFVVQTKKAVFCASAVIHSSSAIICVNRRLIAPNPLSLAHFPWRALRLCESHFIPSSVTQNSMKNFNYVWLDIIRMDLAH